MLSKEVSSTIFKFFGMTRPGIEPRSPEPLENTLSTRPMGIICSSLYILRAFVLLHPYSPHFWLVLFLLLFSSNIVCLRYLLSVKPCASSSVSLFYDPHFWIPPLYSLRSVWSILQGSLSRYLFLWLDFCCRVLFRELFLFFWGIHFTFSPSLFYHVCL